MASAAPIQNRPYRSHKVPACKRCRSRKIRCHIDIPGEPCLSCRERRLKCQYVDAPTTNNSPIEDGSERRPSKRRRHSEPEDGLLRPRSAPILHKATNNPSASIMLAPHLAEDVDIFNRHLLQHRRTDVDESEPSNYQTLLHDVKDPVVYLTVPRFRAGLPPGSGCGREQLEVVEQLMGPFKREVVDLYFTHVHYNFPILDEETCDLLRSGNLGKVSNNLMCVLYAHSSPFWSRSETLKMHPQPDVHYVWNKAITAILEDFLSPGMPTIQGAVLDQIGRPSVSIVGNITLCGRTLSLAQTFGLHRDPSKWNITENEKSLRIRLWWGCLINDHWSSIAYGTPPQITKGYYDVPRPTLSSLVSPKANAQQKHAATCFVHLCVLTELLGDILPLVYHINPDRDHMSREVERFKVILNDHEQRLPDWLPLPNRAGSCMLWLCFLSIRLILARITFRAAMLEGATTHSHERMSQLCTASSAVLDFILTLGEPQFCGFWLPYATQILVHAITVSLRCTVETQNPETRNTSVSRLQRVIAHMQHARDNFNWDIANYCLERCADPVSRIAALNARELPLPVPVPFTAQAEAEANPSSTTTTNGNGHTGAATTASTVMDVYHHHPPVPNFDDSNFLLSDILDPNAFDFSWDALWDTPSGMTNFSI